MTRNAWIVAVALLTVVGAGCGSVEPEVTNPTMVDAGAPPVVVAPVAPPVGPCDAVQSGAMSAALLGRQSVEAPGTKPQGGMLCGLVGEGQTLGGGNFMLEQGYCYTVLGEALPPVADLDMTLQADVPPGVIPAGPLAALAQAPLLVAANQGLHASMGAKASCYPWSWPLPMQAKLVLKPGRGGPGPVAAQVYRKKQ